ncbi:telomerase-binding protein EST1A isoform X7 [Equus przewalskii]|uniref:Telomerase-binding protein EST1A isoform X7 n=1 Tax=Equus przewalskii TaxID=9798 RepID=A0ABM2F3P1_EQUPR
MPVRNPADERRPEFHSFFPVSKDIMEKCTHEQSCCGDYVIDFIWTPSSPSGEPSFNPSPTRKSSLAKDHLGVGSFPCFCISSLPHHMFEYTRWNPWLPALAQRELPSSFKEVIAADCKRVTVLKYFLEALCGQEEPLLAFKGGKYVSVAPVPDTMGKEMGSQEGKQLEDEEEDVVIEDFEEDSEAEGSGGEDDIRELRAKKLALARKIAEQQRRQEKIQAVLEDHSQMRQMELEIRPLFLVPDTNGFIDHLASLARLLESRKYILVVPLIVINELDGLAKGQETDHRAGGYARVVQEKARKSIEFLERRFESRDSCLRALTSRGNELESIAFRSEDITGQLGNNDDLILSCCLHYCKDKAKDFMPTNKEEPIRLLREVVLLTDDRNLRVKALTRNVPVRDIPAFLTWAQVG